MMQWGVGVVGKPERKSVYEMIEYAIRLIEEEKYPMDVAVGIVITKSLTSDMMRVDAESLAIFRDSLSRAVGAIWGLSAVVEADRHFAGERVIDLS